MTAVLVAGAAVGALIAAQPAAVVAELLEVIASIAAAPPLRRYRLAEHPWGRWARERGLPDAGSPEA